MVHESNKIIIMKGQIFYGKGYVYDGLFQQINVVCDDVDKIIYSLVAFYIDCHERSEDMNENILTKDDTLPT